MSALDAIPRELRDRPQWVCWRRVQRRGPKPTKVPYDPRTDAPASTTDPRTWVPFDLAAACAPGYDGAGYVFAADDPYCGVDLDGAYRPDGALYDWAREIVAAFPSYAERSPGGTGLHVIVRGTLREGRRRCGAVEVYDRARYFTMTGLRLPEAPAAIAPCQAALDDLVAHLGPPVAAASVPVWGQAPVAGDLRARAASGRIRRETLALLDSTGPAHFGSASEADSALAAGLASAGLTADEILALIAGSARGADGYRRKGQRHGDYYWRRTVEHAALLVGPVLVRDGLRGRLGGTR